MASDKDVSVDATAPPLANAAGADQASKRPSVAIGTGSGLEGKVVGGYRITKRLGAGAMGDVYHGEHIELRRPVAIKVLKPQLAADASLVGRFFAEARAVNLIRHENIVECTDILEAEDGRSYIIMELLDGVTLGDLLARESKLPWRRAAAIAAQVADAIGAAHDQQIVHRDLKPDNIYLIERRETSEYVKVLDFGIAHLHPNVGGLSATRTGAMLGTPAYMSPEQCKSERATAAVDIYCLGVILYQMLAGQLPFSASNAVEIMTAHLQEVPVQVSTIISVPMPLDALVKAMLEKDPEDRPSSMADIARRLRALATVQPSAAELAPTIPPPAPTRRRGKVALMATAALAIAAIAAFILSRTPPEPPPPKKERAATTPGSHHQEDARQLSDLRALIDKQLAVAFLTKGDFDLAVLHAERSIAHAPDSLDARFDLGLALLGQERYERAMAQFDEVVRRQASYPNVQLVRGETYLLLGKIQESTEALERALENGDDDRRAHYAMGHALRKRGDQRAAAESFCAAHRAGDARAKPLCPSEKLQTSDD